MDLDTDLDPVTIATFPVRSGVSFAGSHVVDWKIPILMAAFLLRGSLEDLAICMNLESSLTE